MADSRSVDTFQILSGAPYWEPKFSGLFSPGCCLELPYAPPGMPQYLDAVERPLHFEWLTRTTRNWKFSDVEPYGAPPDGDVFWLMRTGTCLAGWGGRQGAEFRSRFIVKLTIQNGVVTALKELSDPLAYLRAAGRSLPVFPMVIDPEAAEREKPLIEAKRHYAGPACSDPAEVCLARKERALDALRRHRLDPEFAAAVQEAPNIDGAVYFAPPDMNENCTPHRQPGHLDWLAKSEVSSNFSADAFPVYATADPEVYFDECCYHGLMHWPGSPEGHYRNVYIDKYVFDHGYLKEYSEALNPINKFNSINVSLPTFPYYFD